MTPLPFGGNDKEELATSSESENGVWHLQCHVIRDNENKKWLIEILTMSVFYPSFLIHCDVNRDFFSTDKYSGASLCYIYMKISAVWLYNWI